MTVTLERIQEKNLKMVLFLMFFPGFGCTRCIFTVNRCRRNVSARNVCLSMGCKQSQLASSLKSLSSVWTGLFGCQPHSATSGRFVWKRLCVFWISGLEGELKKDAIIGNWDAPRIHVEVLRTVGFSLSRNSSGAIGWYFIIYGILCGEYFESAHTRKLYVCMYF